MSATKKPKEEAKVFNNEKYKDDFGKYKKRFFSDVEDVLEKTSLSPKKDVGRYQYEDVVYWFYVELPKEKLKEEYSNISTLGAISGK